ncbi:dnaJ homolog subfamily C member 3 [Phlebotomus argentipes]|uniref:dnaJ homolog subfamily C member 3 n=1 Tax=Phlebotomus argentipes TaxID=94469 RepID=UPI002892F6D9|nr:dnaJ homolog subfamily C member 3 [Phlebotomus argentipes]
MVMSVLEMAQFAQEKKLTGFLLLLILDLFLDGAESATQAEINRHLEMGRDYLARNQLADALTHYHAAVEGDPSNYLALFHRGTVYYALGKARNCLSDFSRVLEIKPDFSMARGQRGIVYLRLGDFDSAEIDFHTVLLDEPYNEDVNYLYSKIDPAREQWESIEELRARGDYRTSIAFLTQLLEISPWCAKFRETRADCYIKENDVLSAVSDLRSVNRLSQDSTAGYFRLAELLYNLGHTADALKEIRECLKLDPEHKDCFPFYKKLKKVEKALSDAQQFLDERQFVECVESAEKALKFETEIPMVMFSAKQLLCSCHVKEEQFTQAVTRCREALELHKDPSVLCDRAEAFIGTEMFDDAIKDYQAAINIDEHLQRAKEGLERAKRLQKQSERRDYYKILNVKRTATKQEVIKAYRKAAQKWHPDNFQGDEKKIAEKKFIDIAAAKEVLTDPEKRQQFDNGEDPLDPEGGSQHGFRGGNPFHHFHHGSPFQFKFHFN